MKEGAQATEAILREKTEIPRRLRSAAQRNKENREQVEKLEAHNQSIQERYLKAIQEAKESAGRARHKFLHEVGKLVDTCLETLGADDTIWLLAQPENDG